MMACFAGLSVAQSTAADSSKALKNWRMPRLSLIRDNAYDGISSPIDLSLFKDFLAGLNVGGYYRGYFYNRDMGQTYGAGAAKHTASVGDGYFDPTMLLYLSGSPTPSTSFTTEVMIANPFAMYRGPGSAVANITPYFSAVLRGNMNTKIGSFNIVAGGIEWQRLTPFTFGSNTGYNRYSIFERRPWDPAGNIKNRYSAYYYSGSIAQDARWGTQAFKGFMLNGLIKPLNTYIDFFYGQTGVNGGINREKEVRPAKNIGLRLKRNLKNNNYISLNTFNSYNRSDSVNSSNDIQWNIITSEFNFKYKGFSLAGEVGAGRYMSPTFPEAWSEALIFDLQTPKKYTGIPLEFRYFQIGKNFSSNVANFNNNTIREINTGYNNNGMQVNTPFGPGTNNVGDLSNNRRGVAVNTAFKLGKFAISTGTQISAEMEKMPNATVLNFGHRINNLLWSRLPGYYPMTGSFGPNKRVSTFYRGAYEEVKLSDVNADSTVKNMRFFNSFDFQVKYKTSVLHRDLYVNYLGTFNSVQKTFSGFTVFDNSAYITAAYHEVDVYYQLHKNFMLTFYGGFESIKGNSDTDIDATTKKPRDQTGTALGVGFDLSLSNQTTLYLRQRWSSFEDKNFATEKFSGNEGTIELKIMF